MTHGTRDWDVTSGSKTTHKLTDMAELAARLGSPVHYDRRGDVIWIDGFEEATNRYDFTLDQVDASVARSTTRAQSGVYSYKLVAPNDGIGYAGITASTPDVVRSKIGLEWSFNLPDHIGAFFVGVTVLSGTAGWDATVGWDDALKKLLIYDGAGNPVPFATGVDLPINLPTWNTIKLVLDAETHRYVRLLLNERAYDLSAYAMHTFPWGAASRVDYHAFTNGRAGHNDAVYLDNLIITQNEP